MLEQIFIIIILIFSAVIHEVAHGAAAIRLGDPTAKYAGRLTLNPIKHLDLFGSVIVPITLIIISTLSGGRGFIFGWAKPVPINPYNFRDQKYGPAKVAMAGPASNLAIALFFGLALRFIPGIAVISGLDLILAYIVYINLLLAIFNLLPVPPLDGHHILFALLPPGAENFKRAFSQFGLFILLFIIIFAFPWVVFLISIFFRIIVGVSLF
jgi:Zn-dependent protease